MREDLLNVIYNEFAELLNSNKLSSNKELYNKQSNNFEENDFPVLDDYKEEDLTFEENNKENNKENYEDLTFEELVEQENLPLIITSGYRKGSKTKQGKSSNHSRLDSKGNPLAYDIQPFFNGKVDKSEEGFTKLLNILYNNPRVVRWLEYNNKGILEEITPSVMKRTGATGPHLHIGPDTWAKNMSNTRYQNITGLMLNYT